MHCHLEIVMPPTNDVEGAVQEILEPYSENREPESQHSFWDWYVIGGRWAGVKIRAKYGHEKIDGFYKAVNEKEVRCSNVQAGKQELHPDFVEIVDKLWREHFPDGGEVCPLFKHYSDQYEDSKGEPDIMTLQKMPAGLTASHVIVAHPNYDEDGLQAGFMIEDDAWNGVNHVKSDWDGTVKSAIEKNCHRMRHHNNPDRVDKCTPKDDWLVVTVDYHS